jgi:hypothetical protein
MTQYLALRSGSSGPALVGTVQDQVPLWDVAQQKWYVGTAPGGGAVDSVFGRVGVVVAVTGDYDSDQVDNVSGVAGASVSDALDTLAASIAAVVSATPVRSNKSMSASTTTADGQVACATAVAVTPAASSTAGGGIGVRVNGVGYHVGDGTKVGVDCYFSGDGGTTARLLRSVVAGDLLYWVGSVALFELAASTDKIDFDYEVAS